MNAALVVVIIVVLLVALWIVLTYNRFVRLKNMVREAWSGIDVQLKRRADLIPNLVAVVSGYAAHERNTLEEAIRLRTQATAGQPGQRSKEENALTASIKTLIAVAEAYPDLKANQDFLSLQQTLVEVEDQIQFARRYYNGASRDFNILLQSFPSNIIGGMFGYQPFEYFEIELLTERTAPGIDLKP